MIHSTERNKLVQEIAKPLKLIRIRSVIELTGLSKSYIYNLSEKGLFPKSIQLVPGGTSVAWLEVEIKEWIDSRIQERNQEQGQHE